MRTADAAVVSSLADELLTPARLVTLTEKLLARARASQQTPARDRATIERQLTDVEKALTRLTAAVAAGGDVPALVEAIKTQETQRRTLEHRLAILNQPAIRFDKTLERQLRAAVDEWRAALSRQVPHARQIVSKLLAGKLTFTPECREDQKGFRFRATGTIAKLIDGVVQGRMFSLQGVTSPTGFEPVFWP